MTKIVPKKSRAQETLHFLLDHPRRCFVYLFPSHQTWFLLTVVIILTLIDWVSFLLLDIGNPEIDSIPVGHRILDGLVQSASVRAAGFSVVNLSSLAPAVKYANFLICLDVRRQYFSNHLQFKGDIRYYDVSPQR